MPNYAKSLRAYILQLDFHTLWYSYYLVLTTAQQSVKAICKSNFGTSYYLDMSSNELLHVSDEFLKQNSKHANIKTPGKNNLFRRLPNLAQSDIG